MLMYTLMCHNFTLPSMEYIYLHNITVCIYTSSNCFPSAVSYTLYVVNRDIGAPSRCRSTFIYTFCLCQLFKC